MKPSGVVYLIGAGPGDPGLLTRRGAELLGRADVVVYDALVSPEVLRLAPAGAERVYGGKRSKQHTMLQGDLNDLLVARARDGKVVVRLKGGDPYTFGRGGEEAAQLAAARIPFEVVPGVSSAVAAPNYAGIPLTHRDCCSSFTVFTGHADPDSEENAIDWAQVARTPGTKVVMMGLNHIRLIAQRLIREGMPSDTPVALIRWGTTPRQQSLDATLATVGDRVEQADFGAPAVTVIGPVVRLRETLNWFERRPLFRSRVVVTRARDQAAPLTTLLEEQGAEVLQIPVIKFGPPQQHQPLVEALAGLNGYDWIVFTSANGVKWFFNHFFRAFSDLRDLGGVHIAAVGPATAAPLTALHLQVDLVPAEFEAKAIVRALAAQGSLENLRVLLLRAEVATSDLPHLLEGKGAIVDDIACYRTEAEPDDAEGNGPRLLESGADWVTFTSGSTVEHFHARFDLPRLRARFPRLRLASIGPETSRALETLQLKPDIEARPHTLEAMVAAMSRARRR